MLRIPTAAASARGVRRVLVVAADQDDVAGRGSASQASLVPKPGAQRRDADRAGDVRLVELQLGAHVDDAARRRARLARPGAA